MATTNQSNQIKELAVQVRDLRQQVAQVPFESVSGKVKNAHKGRALRKQIARLLTKIHQLSYGHE